MISRRGFFQRIIGATLAAKLAPYLPAVLKPRPQGVSYAEMEAVYQAHVLPGVVDNFFKADPLLAYMKARGIKPKEGPKYRAIVYPPGCLPAEIIGGGDADDWGDDVQA